MYTVNLQEEWGAKIPYSFTNSLCAVAQGSKWFSDSVARHNDLAKKFLLGQVSDRLKIGEKLN